MQTMQLKQTNKWIIHEGRRFSRLLFASNYLTACRHRCNRDFTGLNQCSTTRQNALIVVRGHMERESVRHVRGSNMRLRGSDISRHRPILISALKSVPYRALGSLDTNPKLPILSASSLVVIQRVTSILPVRGR
jgi:hypothetical protein